MYYFYIKTRFRSQSFKISQVLIVLFQKENNANNLVKAIKVV